MRALLVWYRAGRMVRFAGRPPRLPSPHQVWLEALYLFFALVIAPAVVGFLFCLLGLGLWMVFLQVMHAA